MIKSEEFPVHANTGLASLCHSLFAPNHPPLKCRCPMKISDQSRPIYVTIAKKYLCTVRCMEERMQPNPMTTNKEGVQAMIHAKFDATTSKEGGVLIKHADVRAGSVG
jgi:hypothetical protein